MINGKRIGIDARMIEMSGIGMYIQYLMGQGIYDTAVGDEALIRKYDKDVRVIPFEAPIYKAKEQAAYPVRAIREAGVQLMHFPHYNVPMKYSGEYVVTVHDLTHLVFPEFLGNPVKAAYAKMLMNHAVTHAKHILTVSECTKQDILNTFSVKKEDITVTYSAVDKAFRIKSSAEIEGTRQKYNIPKDKKLLLFVGNLKPHKNLTRLLEVMKALKREDVSLVLAGKAFQNLDLDEQEKNLGIRERIIHTGEVSREELVDFYNLADVFVFPSLYEGFGLPPLEAMACGTPVVASNNSAIPEAVGDAGILVDADRTEEFVRGISMLIDDPETAREFVEKGKVQCMRYSPERLVRAVRETLSKYC